MKSQHPKILGREFWLLSLPLLLLGGVALLRAAVPDLSDLNPNPLRIEVDSIEQVKPSIYHQDADTAVLIKFRLVGIAPLTDRNDWRQVEDVSLVAVKDGKVRHITNGQIPIKNDMPIFCGVRGSSYRASFEKEWALRLRDIPHEWGNLELRGRIVVGPPNKPVSPRPVLVNTKTQIAQIEKTGKAVVLPIKIPVKRLDKQKFRL